jgi:hypothetical protein
MKTREAVIAVTVNIPNNGDARGVLDEIAARLGHVVENEYTKNGVDLYGYEGPFVEDVSTEVQDYMADGF